MNHFCILAKFRVEWLSCRTPCLVFEEVLSIFIVTVWWFVFLRALRKFLSSSGLSVVSLFGFSGFLGFLNVIQTATEVHWLLPFLALAHSALPQITPGYIKWSITSADLSLPYFGTNGEDHCLNEDAFFTVSATSLPPDTQVGRLATGGLARSLGFLLWAVNIQGFSSSVIVECNHCWASPI